MSGVNKVILIGNLGKDPEIRNLENGQTVARFTLATSETYKDKESGEKRTITDWHNIVCWRGLAKIAEQYLSKGKQIYIEGKLKNNSWVDKDGTTRYSTEIIADNLVMIGPKTQGQSLNEPGTFIKPPQEDSLDKDNNDLPF